MEQSNKQKTVKLLCMTLLIGASLLILYHCPFFYVLGIRCPGCGMTRALLSLLHLDFKAAFYYHPLFPAVLLTALYIVAEHFGVLRLSDPAKKKLIAVLCSLFLITYVIRLAIDSPVVRPDWEHSLLFRILNATAARF